MTQDDHYCTANAWPVVDDVDGESGLSIMSATITSGGMELYMECQVCGADVTNEYELVESRVRE